MVIPALNEAKTIAGVVRAASSSGVAVVVDDGSTDTTGIEASGAGAVVVRHKENTGYDAALNSGFRSAAELGCEYIVTMDADGQHNPDALVTFLRALDDGADVVVGIRDRHQRFGEWVFARLATAITGVRDPLCGMKAYRAAVWCELGHFDSYGSIGTELVLFAATRGKRIMQIPILTRDRLDAPRFGRRFSANLRIFRALWLGLIWNRNRWPRPR